MKEDGCVCLRREATVRVVSSGWTVVDGGIVPSWSMDSLMSIEIDIYIVKTEWNRI